MVDGLLKGGSGMVGVEGEHGVEGSPGFYTFVRHLGKMGPPSSLLFLTVDGETQEKLHNR